MPRANFDDRLGGYVEVKDRIALFYKAHPDGRLVTASASMTLDPDGVVRVWCQALAYRTVDDPHPAVGWSYLAVPGMTPYTRGSEIENAETSAWGRAIGALGIGIKESIASRNEVASKAGEDERPAPEHRRPASEGVAAVPEPARAADGSLIGTVAIGTAWLEDLETRQTPEGPVIGFRLKSGRQQQKVQARGDLAHAIGGLGTELIGQTVTCWGTLVGEEFTPKGATRAVAYQVLRLERIHGATFDIPAAPGREVPDDIDPDDLECGDVAAPGTLMDGSVCTLFPAHAGPHKCASGSWPR
jgi:hypothetical protein